MASRQQQDSNGLLRLDQLTRWTAVTITRRGLMTRAVAATGAAVLGSRLLAAIPVAAGSCALGCDSFCCSCCGPCAHYYSAVGACCSPNGAACYSYCYVNCPGGNCGSPPDFPCIEGNQVVCNDGSNNCTAQPCAC